MNAIKILAMGEREGLMDKKKLLGINIKRCRLLKELEQKKLAEKLNISESLISRIERGIENPTLETLEKIAEILSVDIGELFIESSQILNIRLMITDENKKSLIRIKEFIEEILKNKPETEK